jgi:TolB-like protein/DNA-binding winged helix-turn-helix (wHTH) protein
MRPSAHSARLIRFGVYEADLRAGELRKQGRRIKLQDQPFQILGILLENHGEVVTREDLQKRLWEGDIFVDFDHSLNTAVMRLREALGDSSDNPRFIETLPKRGYRFIAPIDDVAVPPAEDPVHASIVHPETHADSTATLEVEAKEPAKQTERRSIDFRRIIILSGIVLGSVAILFGLTVHYVHKVDASKAKSEQITSLVVLPMENLSGDKDQDYFADGMTDELIAHLAKIRSLRVISHTSAMAYKGTHRPLSQIARELNADAVVEGTVLRSGNRVRITAELVQVSTDRHLWAETYESQLGDVLTLQSQVASAIVNEIRIKLTPEEQARLNNVRPVSPEVYENYLKGRYYWNRRSGEGLTKAIEYFEQATKNDPQYALAYAGLADCYGIIAATIFGRVPSAEVAPKATAAALRALELDNSLAEAHTSLATVRFNYDWDWPAAATEFQRAIELNPSYATAYQRYSLYLIAMNRTQESIDEINRARDLDPLSISINFSLGWRLYLARQYDRAIEQLRNTTEMDPNYELAHLLLGQAYEQKGDYEHALPELQKAVALSHDVPLMVAALAHAYGTMGKKAEAKGVLEQLVRQSKTQYVSPFYIATVYLGLSEKNTAMDWLEKAYQDRSNGLIFIKVDPELDGLRSDRRFQDLQKKMRLPE